MQAPISHCDAPIDGDVIDFAAIKRAKLRTPQATFAAIRAQERRALARAVRIATAAADQDTPGAYRRAIRRIEEIHRREVAHSLLLELRDIFRQRLDLRCGERLVGPDRGAS